ncbi:VP2 [Gokushovirinae sp.]|nr:VP2 [Gokushovirinae sp.]
MGLWSAIRGDVFSSVAGGIVSSVLGSNSAKKQAALQRQNWAYQQKNAHQFEVGDLKAAGLNPILSATNSQIAGMGSAPSMSDNGVGAGVTNSITAALTRQANVEIEKTKADIALKEAQTNAANARTNAISAGIYGDDTSKASERYGAETANIKADTAMKNSSKALQDSQKTFYDIQGRELVRMTDAQIASIFSRIQNESALTSAQISEIETKKAVNYAQVKALEAQAKDAIEHSNLEYWQKLDIIQDINSYSRKLQNLSDKQRYQYLIEMPGNIQNQAGFGLSLMNPFTNFGFRAGSGYVGSRKN